MEESNIVYQAGPRIVPEMALLPIEPLQMVADQSLKDVGEFNQKLWISFTRQNLILPAKIVMQWFCSDAYFKNQTQDRAIDWDTMQ